ncbi:SPOR domain-containing protein [bacterium]|nr:SPOR domain-containing protein [bacterium]
MTARICAPAIFFALLAALVPPRSAAAQDMLTVARTQMAAGMTADARVIVESSLNSSADPERARLYRALLTAPADSALGRLLELASQGGKSAATQEALERLGDLAYMRGQYSEAATRYQSAADRAADPEASRRAMAKRARAELHLGQAKSAARTLRQAAALGEEANRGMLRFSLGCAKEQDGDTNGAAEDYLALYLDSQSPYQLAALTRLTRIYGGGTSERAGQWRTRQAEACDGTVFDPAWVRPESAVSAKSGAHSAKPEPAASAQAPASSASGGWSLQLGAFSGAARANTMAEEIRRRTGLSPVVVQVAGSRLYRVRLTGFGSKADCRSSEATLKKQRIKYEVIEPGD